MSIFYLEVDGRIYAMNATTDITRNSSGTLSSSLVEDGNYSSDNYVVKPVTISFTGLITDISTFDDTNFHKTTEQYLNGLKSAQIQKIPIKVFYSDKQPPDSNCFFTSFSHSQDSTVGRHKGGSNAFNVNFTLQKTRFAAGARAVARPSLAVAKSTTAKSSKKSATTKEQDVKVFNTYQQGIIDIELAKAKSNGT